jgi:hypothetical protein
LDVSRKRNAERDGWSLPWRPTRATCEPGRRDSGTRQCITGPNLASCCLLSPGGPARVRVLDGRWLHVLQAHVLHTDVVLCYMRATLESGAGGQALQCSRAHWSPAGCKGGLVWSCHETPPSWGLRFVGTTDTDAPGSSASGDGGRLAPLIAESARPLSGFSLAHWPESFRPQGTRSEPVDASTRINETTRLCLATGKAQVTWYYITARKSGPLAAPSPFGPPDVRVFPRRSPRH